DLGGDTGQPGQDPPVHRGQAGGRRQASAVRRKVRADAIELREPDRVPQLVAEVARAGHPVLAYRDVATGRGTAGEREARGIRTKPLDPVQRVDRVAARLGHLLAELVADQAVQRYLAERHRVFWYSVGHRVQAEEHHPGHPEEQDVVAGDQ